MSQNCDSQVLFAQSNHDDGEDEVKEGKEPGNKCLDKSSMVFPDYNLTNYNTSPQVSRRRGSLATLALASC